MEPRTRSLAAHDPELDPPPTLRVRRLPPGALLVPQEYQRLVANPFLALTLFVAWVAGMRLALGSRNLFAVVGATAFFVAIVRLLHYHCLDCGGTGWLFRWREHACDAVVARQLSGRVRRWRGPTPTVQAVLWMYLLAVVAIVAVVTGIVRLF